MSETLSSGGNLPINWPGNFALKSSHTTELLEHSKTKTTASQTHV